MVLREESKFAADELAYVIVEANRQKPQFGCDCQHKRLTRTSFSGFLFSLSRVLVFLCCCRRAACAVCVWWENNTLGRLLAEQTRCFHFSPERKATFATNLPTANTRQLQNFLIPRVERGNIYLKSASSRPRSWPPYMRRDDLEGRLFIQNYAQMPSCYTQPGRSLFYSK